MEKGLIKWLGFYVHSGESLSGLHVKLNNIDQTTFNIFYFIAVCLFT